MKINESNVLKIMNRDNKDHLNDAILEEIKLLNPKVQIYLEPDVNYVIVSDTVYVAISLGQSITKLTQEIWSSNDYFKAMVLDTILTDLLFTLSKTTYQLIKDDILKKEKALSKRLTPGDELNLSMNRTILDKLHTELKCNEYYVIEPLHSLVYMYNIQDDFDCDEDISCKSCANQSCHLRSKYETYR